MKRLLFAGACLSLLLIQAMARDAPYEPSDNFVTDAMLRLVDTTYEDVVYDLGSGDGRVVIAAARDFNARGVGIEIDEELIRKSWENADTAGVRERVDFRNEDLFHANISSATVVTLYLLQAVNIRLRPKLLAELRPGTRVVSNDFHMGDWEPWKKEKIGSRWIYAWIIPEKPKPAPVPTASPDSLPSKSEHSRSPSEEAIPPQK